MCLGLVPEPALCGLLMNYGLPTLKVWAVCTEKTSTPYPFTLDGIIIWSWWRFSFRKPFERRRFFESYAIQFEKRWSTSFLSVCDLCIEGPVLLIWLCLIMSNLVFAFFAMEEGEDVKTSKILRRLGVISDAHKTSN